MFIIAEDITDVKFELSDKLYEARIGLLCFVNYGENQAIDMKKFPELVIKVSRKNALLQDVLQ